MVKSNLFAVFEAILPFNGGIIGQKNQHKFRKMSIIKMKKKVKVRGARGQVEDSDDGSSGRTVRVLPV